MAREKGTFSQSANYELQKEGTIDARQFVDVFADLLNFTASNYIAEGFPVTVRQDSTYEGNTYKKGWYQFLGGALNDANNWEFMGNVIPDWDADTDNPRRIDNKPTHLSQFINDGDKTSPFATLKDIYRTNIVLNYGIVNIEGTYQYDLWADRYIINNVLYTEMLTGSVTLSSPHASLDRIDKIVIHSDGEFRVKEGVPAENPVSPQVDARTEVEVRFILVKGGSTEPETDVYRVYDENAGSPNEWDITLLQGNVDPDNVEYASRGTKSIKFNVYFNVQRIQFSPAEPIYFEDFSELLLDVRADDDHNMFILQINDVHIDQLVHGVRGFEADGNFHTVSFRKDEILTMFEQAGAPTEEGISEIHLWQDNNTHNYWVDNIRLVKDDSGGSPQPVRIQRTSEIPINDGATGVSPYAEMRDLQEMIFTTDPSLYLDPLTKELRANVSDFSEKYIYTGGVQEFVLTSTPTKIIFISVNGQILEDPLTQWKIDVPTKTITILDEMDTGDRVTVHYQYIITT